MGCAEELKQIIGYLKTKLTQCLSEPRLAAGQREAVRPDDERRSEVSGVAAVILTAFHRSFYKHFHSVTVFFSLRFTCRVLLIEQNTQSVPTMCVRLLTVHVSGVCVLESRLNNKLHILLLTSLPI